MPPTQEQANASLAASNSGSDLSAAQSVLSGYYAKQGAPVIPVGQVGGASQVPAQAPVAPPSTAAPALQGHIQAAQDQFTQSLDQAATNAQAAKTSSLDDYIAALKGQQGPAALTNSAYSSSVDPLNAQLKDINNQITAEQVSNRHATEALQANPGGLSTEALNSRVADMNRLSLSKQADLSVIQMARQGQYDSAKTIADRAVAVQVEQQKQYVDALQLAYQSNKDLFTTAEQRQFETAQADRNRQLDTQSYQAKARFDQLIKQHDPPYQAQLQNARNIAGMNASTPGSSPPSTHIIQSGEDPFNIAQQNGTDIATLKAANPQIQDWTKIQPGTALNLPSTAVGGYKNGVPITAEAAQGSGQSQAYALATGLAAPSQYLNGRSATTPAGKLLLNQANAISLSTLGVPFNPAAAEAAFKFRNSQQYQRLANNIPTAIQTIVQAAQAAKTLGLSNSKDLNNARIGLLARGLWPGGTPQQQAAAQQLQSLLALNQDDLGLILGTGSGSDYKTKLGGLIFDATGAPLATDQLASTITNKVTDKLGQYYTAAGVPNGKAYAQQTAQQLVNGSLQDSGVNVDTSGGSSGGVSVTDPSGGVHLFPDAASAARFKQLAGIQ